MKMTTPTSPQHHLQKIVTIEIVSEFSNSVINHLISQRIPFQLRFNSLNQDQPSIAMDSLVKQPFNESGSRNLEEEAGGIEWGVPNQNESDKLIDYYSKKWPHIIQIYNKYIGNGSKVPPPLEEIANYGAPQLLDSFGAKLRWN